MLNQNLKTLSCGITTGAVLCYFSLSNPFCSLAEVDLFVDADETGVAQVYDPRPYYEIFTDKDSMTNQIETIHSFMIKLMEGSEELDPEFSKAVDRHFWDIV